MFFRDTKNCSGHFRRSKRVSSNVKLFLTFWMVKSGKCGSFNGRSTTNKKSSNNNRKSTNNKPHKQQQYVQTAAQTAPNSSNTGKRHQKDQQKHQKDQQKQQQKQQQKLHKQYKQQRKQQKQQQRHEGPEGGAPKVSWCSHCRFLVEFRFFQAFFETPVNFIIIGHLLFARNGEPINCKIVIDILVSQRSATQKRQQKQHKQQEKQYKHLVNSCKSGLGFRTAAPKQRQKQQQRQQQ